MSSTTNHEIIKAFNFYKNTVFATQIDIQYWQSIIKSSIEEYKKTHSQLENSFDAVFLAYNLDHLSGTGTIKVHEKNFTLKTNDLDKHSELFFTWVMNLSIVKVYNAMEIFLLQAIQLQYFQATQNPLDSKKVTNEIHGEIKKILNTQNIPTDTKNNKHIIQFLKVKSTEISSFLKLPIRSNYATNWADFFELISTLRNVIAHNGMILSIDTHNAIKSKEAKDVFEQYFQLVSDENNSLTLQPKVDQFQNFILVFNDFTLNIVKFIFNQRDLNFLGMT